MAAILAPARRPAQQQYSIAVDPTNVQVVSPGGNRATDVEDDFKPIGTGSIREKIRVALGGLPSFVRCCCANMVTALDQKNGNECCMKVHPLRNLGGAMLYGFLFPPFIFALLQQSMIDKTAIDPFAPVGSPSGGAWVSGSIFLTSVMLFCLFGFTVLPGPQWYTPGSGRLAILLFAVVVAIWIQQLLTLRYILLRPELSHLTKNKDQKERLCGTAYSTFKRGNLVNYVYCSVLVSEFFLCASVCYHPAMPWTERGATSRASSRARSPTSFRRRRSTPVSGDDRAPRRPLIFVFVYMLPSATSSHKGRPRRRPQRRLRVHGGTLYTTVVSRLKLASRSSSTTCSRASSAQSPPSSSPPPPPLSLRPRRHRPEAQGLEEEGRRRAVLPGTRRHAMPPRRAPAAAARIPPRHALRHATPRIASDPTLRRRCLSERPLLALAAAARRRAGSDSNAQRRPLLPGFPAREALCGTRSMGRGARTQARARLHGRSRPLPGRRSRRASQRPDGQTTQTAALSLRTLPSRTPLCLA